MLKLRPTDPETRSPDFVAENIEKLKALFPELVTEGEMGTVIDLDVLKQLVGDQTVTDAEEKYGLNWHGKRAARKLALTPSTGTLRPCPEESVDWDKTQNLMIEGDNLEVLKLLQKSYAGKVKLIYIDPPYNTGNDFVYPDDFKDNIRNYLELTGQVDGEGRKLTTNTEASGRFHTDWLNMMYPRLRLARDLLREDGAIFVSIADHEIHNLRSVMDEVFGPENFVATVIWQKVFSPKNSARHFSEDHDYIVVYARNGATWTPRLLPRSEEMESRYANPDNDPRGDWTSGDLCARNYYSEGTYSVTCPSGRVIEGPPPGTYWRVSKARFEEMDREGRIWWGADRNNMPRLKRFLSDVKDGRVPQTLWFYQDVGHTQEAKRELLASVQFPNSDVVFDTPKPTRLLRRILHLATAPNEEAIILDFFAGTGSTMHAAFAQNSEESGNRRCILVQLPEPMEGGRISGQESIVEVTKERLRRAGQKIRDENPLFKGDTGFRVFKLDSSNIREWDPETKDVEKELFDHKESLKPGRTEADVLYELLLKLGIDLCEAIETRQIAGKTVHAIGHGALFACLDGNVSVADAEPLALGIVGWRKELNPASETTCVFRDAGFENDVAKTNLVEILRQHDVENVRSL